MHIDVFTLFPEWFGWFRGQRHVRNALRLGHELRLFNYRDTTPLPNGQVDDTPLRRRRRDGDPGRRGRRRAAGGLRARHRRHAGRARAWSVLTPAGRPLDDARRGRAGGLERLTLLCGRYEGIDERVREHLANDALSVGPYVLSGGELAAMVVADAVLRKLPGALGDEHSAVEESFSAALEGGRRVPALHAPGELSRLGGAGRAAVRPSRARFAMAAAGGRAASGPAAVGSLTSALATAAASRPEAALSSP